MIIAIDGPAGAGKSTVCRILAQKLHYTYLDTGAMYRAIAWALLQQGFPQEEDPNWLQNLHDIPLHFTIEDGALSIFYLGQRMGDELRNPEITQQASRISQMRQVRDFLTQWQRRLADDGKIVAEGRDMTTVVFPDAPVKIFLTADLRTRTLRRLAEYRQKGIDMDYESLEQQIRNRDEADSNRALAPLRPTPEAFVLDTSGKDIPEVVSEILSYVSEREKEA